MNGRIGIGWILGILWWLPLSLAAQEDTTALPEADTIIRIEDISLHINDSLTRIDSLWYAGFYNDTLDHYIWEKDAGYYVSDSLPGGVVWNTDTLKAQIERLNATSPIEIVYHPALESTIRFFLTKRRKYLERLFGQAERYYFPLFEQQLAAEDIPLEIKYLPIIESALNPKAESRMGARGLWQFMYFTGKRYGLEITSYLDERFSPERSTRAAVRHLNDLYDLFHDWNLVLAAYNSGPGNVTKAIRQSGGYRNYWNLRPYLPRETAGYIPQFQAVWFLHAYKDYYGIRPARFPYDFVKTDTVQVAQNISFDQLHRIFGIPEKELEFLNPEYKLNVVPYSADKHYSLRLPYYYANLYKAYEPLINDAVRYEWSQREKPLPKFYKLPNYVVYTVRSGDCLGCIARRYRTTVSKIKRWNHLRSTRLRIGQKLKIYTRYPHAYASSSKGKSSKTGKSHKTGKKVIYHTVRPGDSLWNLSRKYGVSVRDLQRWNGLKNHKIKPGTKLKIYKS